MAIKYNEFGEVMSINGLTTGQHIGTPMQDAKAELPEHNQAYSEEASTVTRVANTIDDTQPNAPSGGNGDIVIVKMNTETMQLEKTPAEIFELINAGKLVLFFATGTTFTCSEVGSVEAPYYEAETTHIEFGKDKGMTTTFCFDKDGNLSEMRAQEWFVQDVPME